MKALFNPSSISPLLTDLALLIARAALGIILIAHGWQKFDEWTIAGTGAAFDGMGIPLPEAAAVFVTGAELIGGAALVVGLFTPIAAVINIVGMLGALFLVHLEAGIFVDEGGYELVLAIFAGLIILAFSGAGRFSADRIFSRSVTSR